MAPSADRDAAMRGALAFVSEEDWAVIRDNAPAELRDQWRAWRDEATARRSHYLASLAAAAPLPPRRPGRPPGPTDTTSAPARPDAAPPDPVAALLTILANDPAARAALADVLAPELSPRSLHTTATLARELGVTERTVRRAIETGELPAARRMGRWVMTPENVMEWHGSGRPNARTGPNPAVPRGTKRRNVMAGALGHL
ncbi:MAG: hypothetical protein JWM31_1198 [Solirubrobacterales bacterium]|nr:hypothetical protein [Solirubrobacterales bacterium]